MTEENKNEIALLIEVSGAVAIKDNIGAFKEYIETGLANCDASQLITDEDFDNGKELVKKLKAGQDQIKAGLKALDNEDTEEVRNILNDLNSQIAKKNTEYSKAITARRDERKKELVNIHFAEVSKMDTKFPESFEKFNASCQDLLKGKSSFAKMEEAIIIYKDGCIARIEEQGSRLNNLKEKISKFFEEHNIIRTETEVEKGAMVFVKENYSDDQVHTHLSHTKLENEKTIAEAEAKKKAQEEDKKEEELRTPATIAPEMADKIEARDNPEGVKESLPEAPAPFISPEEEQEVKEVLEQPEWIVTRRYSVFAETEDLAKAKFVEGKFTEIDTIIGKAE